MYGPEATVRWRRHEVPFSWRAPTDPRIVRGTIDCLAEDRTGVIRVLEFKTGQPSRAHEAQLAVYVAAARALFPEARVEGQVIYAAD
jgi:RecB family exonuclease